MATNRKRKNKSKRGRLVLPRSYAKVFFRDHQSWPNWCDVLPDIREVCAKMLHLSLSPTKNNNLGRLADLDSADPLGAESSGFVPLAYKDIPYSKHPEVRAIKQYE